MKVRREVGFSSWSDRPVPPGGHHATGDPGHHQGTVPCPLPYRVPPAERRSRELCPPRPCPPRPDLHRGRESIGRASTRAWTPALLILHDLQEGSSAGARSPQAFLRCTSGGGVRLD